MHYVLYCRKSSEAEDRQVLSIDSQEAELTRLAEREGFTISKVYKEAMSAKASGRPIFEQMLSHIEKKGDCILLGWKLDRLARNMVDGGRIIELMDRGIIREIHTPDKTLRNIPEDKFMMTLDFGIAKKYVDDLSVNVKRGNRAKLEQGGWPGPAPLGYLNDKANKTVVIDPANAHYIRRVFEAYASGGYSLIETANLLYSEGWRTRSGTKVRRGQIHRMLMNPFYMGIMLKGGKYYPGKHEAIVSKELYDQTNSVLNGKLRPQKRVNDFHLRGFLKCASCGCMLTASRKKGHEYYYCTNGKGICTEHKKYMRSEKLDELVADALALLQSDPELVELAYDASKERVGMDVHYAEANLLNLENALKTNEEKQLRLADSFMAENTPEAVYNAKMRQLMNEEVALKKQIADFRTKSNEGLSTLEPIKDLFLKGISAQKTYLESENEEKRILVQELLWNLAIGSQKVQAYQWKNGFAELAKTPKPSNLSEMLGTVEAVRTWIKANQSTFYVPELAMVG